ncbi:MAG: siroheme synthase CysG [Terracidiphilus sp.]
MNPLPIFLKLEGRRVLIVGAGCVALEKTQSLSETGARIVAVAPEAVGEMRELSRSGRIDWQQREYAPGDLDGAALVIAATDRPEVNSAIYSEARRRGIPANSVDDPPNCDFYFGAVVRRGALLVAVSTSGESPAVAQKLRAEIDEQLDPGLDKWLDAIGRRRREILKSQPASPERKALLKGMADRPLLRAHCSAAVADGGRTAQAGTVYLTGAGPGDPDLLTVKALRLLQSADVILHDDLVAQAILDLASPSAEIVNVGKRCGEKTITQGLIHTLMIFHARAGRSVLRLKSGDPMLFGRAAEEMAALKKARVPYEIVPGISAAFAAAAAAGCSLTSRNSASGVLISTAHRASSRGALTGPVEPTRVIYMPGRDLAPLAQMLLGKGLSPDLPCAVVSRASQPGQSVQRWTLGSLAHAEPIEAPSLLLVGQAVNGLADDSFKCSAQSASGAPCCAR